MTADTKTMPMPDWPDEADYISIEPPDGHEAGREDYERARAEAAIARLRVAVEALRQLDGMVHSISQEAVSEALARIGPLPEAGE